MKQVSVYLDSVVIEQLEIAARENGFTLAGYIAAVISGHCANILKRELEAKKVLLELIATAEPDQTFVRPAEIPMEMSIPREAFN